MTPEHLVDSAKLYDYYVNGFDDGKYSHRARVHLPTIPTSVTTSAPIVYSAPTILDLLNTENVEPSDVDIAAIEDRLFNHPDPYDLDETERVDEALQVQTVVRSSTRLDISDYVKLDDPKLKALITKVDSAGPGTSVPAQGAVETLKKAGKPGEWNIESFLGST